MRALVVIPTYNEAENLPEIVPAVLEADPGIEVLVVDDNSPDGTGDIAESIAAGNNRIHVLHRRSKLGLGTAYLEAFRWAIERHYDAVVEMDADFSHDPAELPKLLERSDGSNLVVGSRYVPGGRVVNWAWGRKMLSRYGNRYASFCLGLPVADSTGGFRVYSRKVLEEIDTGSVRSNGYAFQIEMAYNVWRRGFPVVEVPITFTDRRVGHSKMSKRIVAEGLWWVTIRGIRDLWQGLKSRDPVAISSGSNRKLPKGRQ